MNCLRSSTIKETRRCIVLVSFDPNYTLCYIGPDNANI